MVTPPILIYDGGDFIFLRNLADAENFLEPFDIEEGKVHIFDSLRQGLRFVVQKRKWSDKVVYSNVEERESVLDLRYELAVYIARHTGDIAYLDAPWDKLINFVIESNLFAR